ncbi:MAG TPA: hypothetical protein VFZ70_00270 [Euzebyales bacterium]
MSETTVTDVRPGGVPVVGQTASMSRTVSHRDIELFSEISGDDNPLHDDEEYATALPPDAGGAPTGG